MNEGMTRWNRWGKDVLREGDIVFRLGDARALRGSVPAEPVHRPSHGQRVFHTGIVAIEGGSPVVYDCSSDGVQHMPFEVWMLDCVGAHGREAAQGRAPAREIPGVIAYCRAKFRTASAIRLQVPARRFGILLRRADGKGVSIAGAGAFGAGEDRRLGASGSAIP